MGKREHVTTLLIAPTAKRIVASVEFLLKDDQSVHLATFRFDQTPSREELDSIRDYLSRVTTKDD